MAAAAEEVSMDAGELGGIEGFSRWKICFQFLPDWLWLATGR